MKRTLALIGVPSSAGAHWPGQEGTPRFLRDAGLTACLEAAGFEVIDFGDLPLARFRPDREQRHQQNLAAVVAVARLVSDQVALALRRNAFPLVIGGDCTIGLGVIAGFLSDNNDLGLLYFDGHVDLNTPATSPSGILDSMGVAHVLGEPGTADKLSHIGARFPLLPEDRIVLFGYNPREMNAAEREILERRRVQSYPLPVVQSEAARAAAEAVGYLEKCAKRFLVHFDVDVIDFTDFPIADVPQFSQGLMFKDVMECLTIFASSPRFSGLTVTEFNPDRMGDETTLARRFMESLAEALAGGNRL